MAEYYFSKKLSSNFEETIELIKSKLPEIGFGIVSEIDVTATFKKKLGVDFRNYRILGACHPQTAYNVMLVEDKIGTMLPCNIIVQEWEDGIVEVSSVDPIASMASVQNPSLADHAFKVQKELKDFINSL